MALNSTGSYSQNSVASSSSSSSTPSLVVSVPLSTATIPGLNLPPATSNSHTTLSHMHNSNNFQHQHGSGSIVAQQQHRTTELMVSRMKIAILVTRVLGLLLFFFHPQIECSITTIKSCYKCTTSYARFTIASANNGCVCAANAATHHDGASITVNHFGQ